MVTRIEILDALCHIFRLPKYSMLRDFHPVDSIRHLTDRPEDVYVWILKTGIDDVQYGEKMGEIWSLHEFEPRATHIFLTGGIERIKKLQPDYVQNLLKFHYSDEAREGGRKQCR